MIPENTERFNQLINQLRHIQASEATLTSIELLFFGCLNWARHSPYDVYIQHLLVNLIVIKENEHRKIYYYNFRMRKRNKDIKKFKSAFASAVRVALKRMSVYQLNDTLIK